MIFAPTVNHSAAAQLSQQQQQPQNGNNITLATELAKKLAPGSSLANFQEQLKGLGQQLGLNGTLLSQLRQQLPAVNITEVGQKLEQISSNIP
jgi:hypothetical protein